jgi:preprotein translocase subunit YajC
MFVLPAAAQDAAGAAAGGTTAFLIQIVPFLLIFVIMYFLILRPQRRRAAEHTAMIRNLRRGDTIVTSGGVIGKITKIVDDSEIQIDAGEGVKLRISRAHVQDLRAKGEPVKDPA